MAAKYTAKRLQSLGSQPRYAKIRALISPPQAIRTPTAARKSTETMPEIARELLYVNLEDEMRKSYLDYAMSVIVGRALPDVRDGLKPVHRRVLYAMRVLGNDWNKAYKSPRASSATSSVSITRTATRPSTTRWSAWHSRFRCAICSSMGRATRLGGRRFSGRDALYRSAHVQACA